MTRNGYGVKKELLRTKNGRLIKHSIHSQLIKQWLSERVTVSNAQSAPTLYHSLPQAIGLLCLKETLGKEAITHLLQRKIGFYGKEKNNEPNTEPLVVFNDGTEYITDGKAKFLKGLDDQTGSQASKMTVLKDVVNL